MEALFLKGAILGFAMAAPIGPVGLITIRTSIKRGRAQGFVMAAAVATADAMYGAVAAFGLTIISDPILFYKFHIQFFGGLLLLALAGHIYISKVQSDQTAIKERSKFSIFTATLLFTLSNPSNIFSFAAVFAALNMATKSTSATDASLIVAGVFVGSGSWFSVLSWFSSKHKKAFTDKVMVRVNKGAGIALALFASYAIFNGYRGLFGV
jgi:threonine/homoserine/homoserine lactone efflux protein